MTQPAPRTASVRADATTIFMVVAVSLLAGSSITLAGYFLPLVLGMAVFGGIAACCTFLVFGAEGGLLAMGALSAMFLMQRFDEQFAIPLGMFEFRGVYIISTLLLCAFVLLILGRRLAGERAQWDASIFAGRWMALWAGFVLSGLVTIAINNAFDRIPTPRYATGELLGLFALVSPMLFLPLALSGAMSERRALWGIHLLVGLGGMAGLILSMFGILPGKVLDLLGWQSTITGTLDLVRGRLPLGHPNHVAAVINMLLPIAIVYGFLGREWRWRLLHLGCAFFMFLGVLFALSRGALLNLTLIAGVTAAYVFLSREYRRWYTPFVAAIAFGMAILVALVLFQKYDFSRLWSQGYYEEASVERRVDSMRTAVQVWKDHPLVGASPNSLYQRLELRHDYEPEFGDRISPIFYYRGMPTAETPHNLFLIAPAEFGTIGAAFFFGTLFYMGLTLLRARRYPGMERWYRHLITAFILSMLGLLLSGVFEAILFAGMRVNVLFWVLNAFMFTFTFHAVARAESRGIHGGA